MTALLLCLAASACVIDDKTAANDPDTRPGAELGTDDGAPDGGSPDDDGTGGGDTGGGGTGGGDTGVDDTTRDDGPWPSAGCAPYGSAADVYTPYANPGASPVGKVSTYPWRGPSAGYPDGVEDFRGYGTSLPLNLECGGTRSRRTHLEVTAGCLDAVVDGGDPRGKIGLTSTGIYRSFALPFAAGDASNVVRWTDQGVEYRFRYATGPVGNTGFKAFTRYRTEYDLYVASWRLDGVVQIQKKACGQYTVLERLGSYGAPSPNAWHTIRFEAVGNRLQLFLDGQLAISLTDATFASGTAGIRIDAMGDALIDDWRVYAP